MTLKNFELATEAQRLKSDLENVKTHDQRAAWNQRLQDHLTRVVDADKGRPLADAIESWCDTFGLRYLPEPLPEEKKS